MKGQLVASVGNAPPGVWAGKGVILRALKAQVRVRDNSFGQRGEPKAQVCIAEKDPSS